MKSERQPRLRPGDYYRILVSGLIAVMGVTIVGRALLMGLTSPSVFLMGAAFTGFGLYRLWLIRCALSDTQGKRGTAATKEGEADDRAA